MEAALRLAARLQVFDPSCAPAGFAMSRLKGMTAKSA